MSEFDWPWDPVKPHGPCGDHRDSCGDRHGPCDDHHRDCWCYHSCRPKQHRCCKKKGPTGPTGPTGPPGDGILEDRSEEILACTGATGDIFFQVDGDTRIYPSNKIWQWVANADDGIKSGQNQSISIDTDEEGNSYVTGTYIGTILFDQTLSSFGAFDVYVAKIDPSGNWIWTNRVGGINIDFGTSIDYDPVSDLVFVSGICATNVTFGALPVVPPGKFIAKLDPATGNWLQAVNINPLPQGDNNSGVIASPVTAAVYTQMIETGDSILRLHFKADLTIAPVVTPLLNDFNVSLSAGISIGFWNIDNVPPAQVVQSDIIGITGHRTVAGPSNEAFLRVVLPQSTVPFTPPNPIFTSGGDARGSDVAIRKGTFNNTDAIIYTYGMFDGNVIFPDGSNPVGSFDYYVSRFDLVFPPSIQPQWTARIVANLNSFINVPLGPAIVADEDNNAYVTGFFIGQATFINPANVVNINLPGPAGIESLFVAKIAPNGNWLYAHSGIIAIDTLIFGSGISIDGSNNIYIGGAFITTNPTTATFNPGGVVLPIEPFQTTMVAKFSDSEQEWKWAVSVINIDVNLNGGTDVSLDTNENVYICGWNTSPLVFDGISLPYTSGNDLEIFVAKTNPDGMWQWVRRAIGPLLDYPLGIATSTATDNSFVVGVATFSVGSNVTFENPVAADVILNSPLVVPPNSSIHFVAKISSGGTWLVAISGQRRNTVSHSVSFAVNRIYLVVSSYSLSTPSSMFVEKRDENLVLDYEISVTSTGIISGRGISSIDDISVVTGFFTRGLNFINVPASDTITILGLEPNEIRLFVAAFDNVTGKWLWAKASRGTVPGDEVAAGMSVSINQQREIYVAGKYLSPFQIDNYRAEGFVDPGRGGYFVLKMDIDGNVLWLKTVYAELDLRVDVPIADSLIDLAIESSPTGDAAYLTGAIRGRKPFGQTETPPNGPENRVFVAKISSRGQWLQATSSFRHVSLSPNIGHGIAVSSRGVYIGGILSITATFPNRTGDIDVSASSIAYPFAAKLFLPVNENPVILEEGGSPDAVVPVFHGRGIRYPIPALGPPRRKYYLDYGTSRASLQPSPYYLGFSPIDDQIIFTPSLADL